MPAKGMLLHVQALGGGGSGARQGQRNRPGGGMSISFRMISVEGKTSSVLTGQTKSNRAGAGAFGLGFSCAIR